MTPTRLTELRAIESRMTKYIDFLCDGPPSHESGRFVELENANGHSIGIGEWVDREHGFCALRVQTYLPELLSEIERLQRIEEAANLMRSAVALPRYDYETPGPEMPEIVSTHAASGQSRCAKHGIGYNGCICCANDVKEHRADLHREADRKRSIAIDKANDALRSALASKGGEK